jgi:hypothetical protein
MPLGLCHLLVSQDIAYSETDKAAPRPSTRAIG